MDLVGSLPLKTDRDSVVDIATIDAAKAMKATHLVDVPVEVASHTTAGSAIAEFGKVLSQAPVRLLPPAPSLRLFSGIDGAPVIHSTRARTSWRSAISCGPVDRSFATVR